MLKQFLSSFMVTLIGAGCAFVSHLVLARMLSVAEYGVFSFVMSLCVLIGVFSLFGFQTSVVRLIAGYLNDPARVYKVNRLLGFVVLFVGALASITGAVVTTAVGIAAKVMGLFQ